MIDKLSRSATRTAAVLVFMLTVSMLILYPQQGLAAPTQNVCTSEGFYKYEKANYSICVKKGKQLIWQKSALTSWQKNLFSSSTYSSIPGDLIDPIEQAAGWTNIPFLKQVNWSTDEGQYPTADGSPLQNGSGDKVLLIGDSLAPAIGPAFLQLQKMYNWNFRIIFRSSCHVSETTNANSSQANLEKCELARQARLKAVQDFQPSVLILTEDPLNPIIASKGKTSFETWEKGFEVSLNTFVKLTKSKIFLISRPVGVKKSLQDCLKGKSGLTADCYGNLETDKRMRQSQKNAIEKVGGTYIDLSPLLCINGTCPPFIMKSLVYRDTIHFTNAFAQLIAPELKKYF